jgi:uncharacterized paraquat-inducible protein A
MSRYIDADALIERLKFKRDTDNIDRKKYAGLESAIVQCKKAPTADVVEVVHAYWKEINHITESYRGREIHSKLYNCSNCDAPNGRKKSSYCHWCGAKMDGERKDGNER